MGLRKELKGCMVCRRGSTRLNAIGAARAAGILCFLSMRLPLHHSTARLPPGVRRAKALPKPVTHHLDPHGPCKRGAASV